MARRHRFEFAFLLAVLLLGVAGFSGLYLGDHAGPDGFQNLHVATSIGWLALLTTQWWVIRRRHAGLHRTIGSAVHAAAPVLVGTLVMLTVHSASKAAAVGRADPMVMQNVTVALEVALLLFLAILLRRQREVHGALMLGTALLFMGIALVFTLIGYVPWFQGGGPAGAPRFGEAAGVATGVVGLLGVAFHLADRRTGWPWLLAGSFFVVNALLQFALASAGATEALTMMVSSIDRAPAFALGTLAFAIALLLARRVTLVRPATQRGEPSRASGNP